MSATIGIRDRRLEVTFLTVPSRADLVELRKAFETLVRTERAGVLALAVISPAALGILDEPARLYLREVWPQIAPKLRAVAVVVEGDGVKATLTRGFVRVLGTGLGRAWTVLSDRSAALQHLRELDRSTASP